MAHDHHDHDSPAYYAKQSKIVWIVGGILFAATVLTVGIAYVDFGSHAANITMGLLLAAVKASLVALIFMHLKSERGLVYKIMFFTVVFAIALFVLTWLGFADPLISKTAVM